MIRSVSVVALLSLLSLALAGPADARPLPASSHAPPVVVDEASVHVRLHSRGSDGYTFRGYVEMAGLTSGSDMARIDWKQKGKLIASAKCRLQFDGQSAYGECTSDTPVKTKGALDGELVYWDDQQEKEYLVRTFKVNVHHWKGMGEVWQIVPDDLLAAAWMYLASPEAGNATYRRPVLYFWAATDDPLPGAVVRCTVDGKTKIPDFVASPQDGAETVEIEADHIPKKGNRQVYEWQRQKLLLDIYWGTRDTLKSELPTTTPKDNVLSDNPGAWACQLRFEGKAIRQFLFTVGADGLIAQDEMQTGTGAIPTVNPKLVLIDVRLTKDSSTFDKRINPAALKKSMGFGLPWPAHPKVKTIHASYPARSGLPNPK